MAAHAVRGIALQTQLCSELSKCSIRLRDLAFAKERVEQRNDGLNLHVSFDDPLEGVDAAVTLDPPHPSERTLQAMKNLGDDVWSTMLCRRRSHLASEAL